MSSGRHEGPQIDLTQALSYLDESAGVAFDWAGRLDQGIGNTQATAQVMANIDEIEKALRSLMLTHAQTLGLVAQTTSYAVGLEKKPQHH